VLWAGGLLQKVHSSRRSIIYFHPELPVWGIKWCEAEMAEVSCLCGTCIGLMPFQEAEAQACRAAGVPLHDEAINNISIHQNVVGSASSTAMTGCKNKCMTVPAAAHCLYAMHEAWR